MRKTVAIIVISLIALKASAQFNLEFHSGYATYSNADLKAYQASVAGSVAYGGKVLESFPPYWYYGADAKWNLPKVQLGLSVSKGSTGGQIYYSDYTGTFRETEQLKYTSIRMLTAVKIAFNNGTTSLQIDPRFGIAFGRLDVNRAINASDETQSFKSNDTYKYKAVNPFVEPTITLSQKVGLFSISAFVGYHKDLFTNTFRQTNSPNQNNRAALNNGSDVSMNLSGLRAGGSIGLYVGRSKEVDYTRYWLSAGLGLDYGGLGLNAMSMVSQHIGVFGGLGYNFSKVGMNGGVRIYATKQEKFWRPFISAMYGYNGAYLVKGKHDLDRSFYGTTIGLGLDFKDWASNFWNVGLMFPIHGNDVTDYKFYLQGHGVSVKNIRPVGISLGYRIGMKKK